MSKWTRFMDMHSGGGTKEAPYQHIYIEASEEEAKVIFYNRFGHNPERVTCTCCGEDYSIGDSETLKEATAYNRGCASAYFRPDGSECDESEAWVMGKGMTDGYSSGYVERKSSRSRGKDHIPLSEYQEKEDVLFVYEKDIKSDERTGNVPDEGYVWV